MATTICWGIFLFVLFTINPEITNWLGFLLFYLSLFLAITGTAAMIGFTIRFVALKHELAFRSVIIAFRQSFLFAFLIVAVLFLLSKDLFTWLNLFLLIIGMTILEYFLISYKTRNIKQLTQSVNNIGIEDSEAL
jgi:hypothetical protein